MNNFTPSSQISVVTSKMKRDIETSVLQSVTVRLTLAMIPAMFEKGVCLKAMRRDLYDDIRYIDQAPRQRLLGDFDAIANRVESGNISPEELEASRALLGDKLGMFQSLTTVDTERQVETTSSPEANKPLLNFTFSDLSNLHIFSGEMFDGLRGYVSYYQNRYL